MEIKLPKLPDPVCTDRYPKWSVTQMAEYAKTAIAFDRLERVSNLLEAITKLTLDNASLAALLMQKHDAAQWTKVPFVVGQVYDTRDGRKVLIQYIGGPEGYECAQGNDHIYRYARPHDQGRTTGTDGTCEHDLMPLYRRNDNAV